MIARVGSDPDHADEPALLEMARGVPVDLFARMTRHYAPQTDSCAEHNRQHQNRWASLIQDPDGSWRLSAYYDYDTGKRISSAFNQMVRTFRNGEGPHRQATPPQASTQRRLERDIRSQHTGHPRPQRSLILRT